VRGRMSDSVDSVLSTLTIPALPFPPQDARRVSSHGVSPINIASLALLHYSLRPLNRTRNELEHGWSLAHGGGLLSYPLR